LGVETQLQDLKEESPTKEKDEERSGIPNEGELRDTLSGAS
jgi:hypothetical protein